jgi:hypothetical protein
VTSTYHAADRLHALARRVIALLDGLFNREAQPFERGLERGCAFIECFAKARMSGNEWETAGRIEGS